MLLVELMIAVVILAGLVGTVTATVSYLRSHTTARSLDSTTVVFQDIAERMKDEVFGNVYSIYDDTQITATEPRTIYENHSKTSPGCTGLKPHHEPAEEPGGAASPLESGLDTSRKPVPFLEPP